MSDPRGNRLRRTLKSVQFFSFLSYGGFRKFACSLKRNELEPMRRRRERPFSLGANEDGNVDRVLPRLVARICREP